MHGMLIALHEASHGLLRKNRLLNEIDGVLIAAFGFMSFSLYRVVHQSHHAHLANEKDEELWPFVRPALSRPARILAAALELTVGFLYTPFLFIRAFLRAGSSIRKKTLRRRIWAEFSLVRRSLDWPFHGDCLVGFMEIFPVAVPGSRHSGCQHAESAQIHRARGTAGLDGKQFHQKHCRQRLAWPARFVHPAS